MEKVREREQGKGSLGSNYIRTYVTKSDSNGTVHWISNTLRSNGACNVELSRPPSLSGLLHTGLAALTGMATEEGPRRGGFVA